MPFPFEPDLSKASTPPPFIYTDPGFLERERQRIFARSWQPVARADQLAESGDFVCGELGGQSIVIVRDGDQLRGFHNLCRHRAGPVADGCGRRRSLQCRYHGWTYGLDGRLRSAPEMHGVDGFEPAEIALAPIVVERRGPVVFASLAPREPIAELLQGIELADDLRWVMRRDYHVEANWKVYVDNFLEGYHVPVLHPELHRELDYDNYVTETARFWSRQHAPLRPLPAGEGSRVYRPAAADDDAAYYWIFPNIMLNIYQGQLQTNRVVPLGTDACRVEFEWYAAEPPAEPDNDPRWRELIEMSDLVQVQDAEICEVVQRNMRSPVCLPGRYSARRENGLHHFHGLLHDWLSDSD